MSDELPDQLSDELSHQLGDPEAPLRPAHLRRSPRYGVFIGTGIVLGVVVAVLLVLVRPGSGSAGIFGYLVVALGAFGALAGGLVAVLAAIALDRADRRRG